MSTVRAVELSTADRRPGWTIDVDARMATVETPIRRLLDPYLSTLAAADAITLVPDAHYPFHPSTGMVTDPAVVGSVVSVLDRETDAELAVALSNEHLDADRTVGYLGYDDVLDRFETTIVTPAESDRRTDERTQIGDQQVTLSVPEQLARTAVVPIPTLRPTRSGPIAGGMRTLARHVACSVDSELAGAAATAVIDPELSLLDATIVYAGESYRADTLFSGPIGAVDAVGADLLGRDPGDDPSIVHHANESVRVDGLDVAALADRCPDGELPPPTDPHPAMSLAYRTYAAVSGDAVPPQLEDQ